MGKQTKRQRKFQASGGVKKRIEKGTITKDGKLKRRKSTPPNNYAGGKKDAAPVSAVAPQKSAVLDTVDRSDDLTHPQNLGDMDIDTFFAQFAEETPELSSPKDDGDDDSSRSSSCDDDESASASDGSDVEAAEATMKLEMEKMKQQDPEFHQFLQTNEKSLLEFGKEDEDEEESHEEDKDGEVSDDQDDNEPEKSPSTASGIEMTSELLTKLATATFQNRSVKSLKKLVAGYKSACFLSNQADESKKLPYYFEDSKVYDSLMVTCLNKLDTVFWYHLFGAEEPDDSQSLNPNKLEKAASWKELKGVLSTFYRSTLHVVMEAKEPELLVFVLKSLSRYMRFLTPFPKLAESMLKTLTALWSAPLDTSESYQVVRLNAFFRIRQLAVTQPFPFIESILKKTYLAYAKRAKFGASFHSPALVTLTFMGNCLVELYSLDVDSSYQHGFVYIRQLALLLRAALQKKTKESMQQVYCWQFVHCLKLWVSVLAAAAPAEDGAPLRSLLYPLTEIILGTVRMAPSPIRHLPLRFHCVRQLQQLAAASEVFIPTTSILLDCLDWKEWYMSPKSSQRGTTVIQLNLMLKLGKDDALRTHEQLEAAIREFFLLLNREIELYRYSAGFAEFSVRIVSCLRHFSKQTRNPRWRAYAKACMDTCDKHSKFCVDARSQLQEAPRDIKTLECLRPPHEKTMRERHEASIEKEQKAIQESLPSKKRESEADRDDEADQQQPKSKKNQERTPKKSQPKPSKAELDAQIMDDSRVLDMQDKVQSGVDWSDEE